MLANEGHGKQTPVHRASLNRKMVRSTYGTIAHPQPYSGITGFVYDVVEIIAGEIADRTFIALDENTLVADGAKTLYEQEGCSIIVTRNDKTGQKRVPVGIVTERDIIFRVVAQNKGPFKMSLKDIMSTPLISIGADKPAKQALSILKEKKINRLAVINEKGELEGLLTTEMIAKRLPENTKAT